MPFLPYKPIAPHVKVRIPFPFARVFRTIYDHGDNDPHASDFAKLRRYLCGAADIFPIDAMIAIAKSGEYRNGFCLPMELHSGVYDRFLHEWNQAMGVFSNEFTPEMKSYRWYHLDLKQLKYATQVLQTVGNYCTLSPVVLIASQETLKKTKKAA
jgi:hypothetical protein